MHNNNGVLCTGKVHYYCGVLCIGIMVFYVYLCLGIKLWMFVNVRLSPSCLLFQHFQSLFFPKKKKAVVFTYEGLGLYLIRQKLNFNSAYLNYYLFIYIYLFFMVQLFEYNETLVPLQKLKI